jgi:uncharacterized phage protein (TIGR02220 family)
VRHFVIPETFFKSIAEKGKLYSRLWFYWLSEFVDELFEPEFLEKMVKKHPSVSEIKEIYEFGVQLLQQDFKIIEKRGTKNKTSIVANKATIKTAQQILDYLNTKAETTYSTKTGSNLDLVISRLNEGYTISDFKYVIDFKVKDWKGSDFQKYLRPITLFKKDKFENYLNSTINDTKHQPTSNRFSKLAESVAKAQTILGIHKD